MLRETKRGLPLDAYGRLDSKAGATVSEASDEIRDRMASRPLWCCKLRIAASPGRDNVFSMGRFCRTQLGAAERGLFHNTAGQSWTRLGRVVRLELSGSDGGRV